MKKNIIFFLLISLFLTVNAQLKNENFLYIDSSKHKISANNLNIRVRGYTIYNTGFKYEKDLDFFYSSNYGTNYCCNYYEVKAIPKDWNIITVKNIVAHMEDKSMGFSFKEKKLFIVEYDKERKIYKAYQVDIIGWPREE